MTVRQPLPQHSIHETKRNNIKATMFDKSMSLSPRTATTTSPGPQRTTRNHQEIPREQQEEQEQEAEEQLQEWHDPPPLGHWMGMSDAIVLQQWPAAHHHPSSAFFASSSAMMLPIVMPPRPSPLLLPAVQEGFYHHVKENERDHETDHFYRGSRQDFLLDLIDSALQILEDTCDEEDEHHHEEETKNILLPQ